MSPFIAAMLLLPAASAQETDELGLDPSLPIPTLDYERPPPDFSWEFGLQMSYGHVTYWMQEVEPWVGLGLRFGWGRNLGVERQHRVGVTAVLFAEGPVPLLMSAGVDPQLSWDWVTPKGIWLGAGVGAAAMFNSKSTTAVLDQSTSLAPSASARIGWSQSFSRVGRRFFVGFEGRARYTNGNLGPQGALVLGSGRGY